MYVLFMSGFWLGLVVSCFVVLFFILSLLLGSFFWLFMLGGVCFEMDFGEVVVNFMFSVGFVICSVCFLSVSFVLVFMLKVGFSFLF